MRSEQKYNSVLAGMVPGLILPLLTFAVFGLVTNQGDLKGFVRILDQIDRFASVISLSVIPNLLLFFIFIWTGRLISARGVLFSTFFFALVMLIFKYV